MNKFTISYVNSDMPGKGTGFKENEVTIHQSLSTDCTPDFSLQFRCSWQLNTEFIPIGYIHKPGTIYPFFRDATHLIWRALP